jgi:hypothetical protein
MKVRRIFLFCEKMAILIDALSADRADFTDACFDNAREYSANIN